jgi:hypothetical protein
MTPTPTPTPIVVIDRVQSLGRIETAQYSMQTVTDVTSDMSFPIPLPPLLGQQKMLLIAAGDVIAGFDLTQIAPRDISVQGTRVRLVLPPAQILVTRIDNKRTYVYWEQKPFYMPNDKNLEGKARQTAEEQLTKYALEQGILMRAEEYGKYHLEAFLRGLGFTEVDIQVRSASADN